MASAFQKSIPSTPVDEIFKTACENLDRIGRPHLKDENFKFTPLQDVNVKRSSSQDAQFSENQAGEYLPQEEAQSLIYSGGQVQGEDGNGQLETWPQFLARVNGAEAFNEAIYPSSVFEKDYFAWAALNDAFSGFYLRIPKDLKVELPLHFFLNLVGESSHHRLRTRIHLEEGASLSLFSGAYSTETTSLFHLQSFVLERGSTLDFCDFQSLSEDSRYFIRQEFLLGSEAKVSSHWATKSSGLGQIRVHVENRGPKSLFQGRRSLAISGRQHSDFWIENRHAAEESISSMQQWAVLDDKAKSVFNGLIRIQPRMHHSDALHKSRSLMLSDRASSENMPKLIIETDDVKVSHGASISNLDPEQLYYLESRGIQKEEAKTLMISGFLRSSWEEVESQPWKDFLDREFYSS